MFLVPKECTNRTYGEACSGLCGQCHNLIQCDVISGNCPVDCEPGYSFNIDQTCKTSNYTFNSLLFFPKTKGYISFIWLMVLI